MILNNKEELLRQLEIDLSKIKLEKQAIEIKNIFCKKYLNPIYDALKKADINDKKTIGQEANQFSQSIKMIIDRYLDIIKNSNDSNNIVNYDINLTSNDVVTGSFHPLTLITNQLINFFDKMGFTIFYGNEIVDTKANFDYLNIDKNHHARSESDSFYFDLNKMLRVHCTASTAEFIHNNKSDDIRVVSFGNVYRNDDDDQTHSHQFMQLDFMWIRENLNIKNLKWLITELLKELFGQDIESRFRLSHFPFTEPSFEVDMKCHHCNGKGCSVCKQSGWIEILGAGMLHSNVLKSANIKIKTGLAAGIGIERLAMIKYGISDVREFYTNNFRFLEQFK